VHVVKAREDEVEGEELERNWGQGRKADLRWARECLRPHIKVISAGKWDGESVGDGMEGAEVQGVASAR